MLALQQTDLFRCKVSQPAENKFSPAHRFKQQGFAKEGGVALDKSHCRRDIYFSISNSLENNTIGASININAKKSVLINKMHAACLNMFANSKFTP